MSAVGYPLSKRDDARRHRQQDPKRANCHTVCNFEGSVPTEGPDPLAFWVVPPWGVMVVPSHPLWVVPSGGARVVPRDLGGSGDQQTLAPTK